MWKPLQKFWRDERGYVPVTEWMLVASLLTLGIIATLLVQP
jgi:Flp pilus assembly pilin Flp